MGLSFAHCFLDPPPHQTPKRLVNTLTVLLLMIRYPFAFRRPLGSTCVRDAFEKKPSVYCTLIQTLNFEAIFKVVEEARQVYSEREDDYK